MKQHYIVPRPSYPGYMCYPDMFGRYVSFPEHAERREEGSLKEYNLHLIFRGRGYVIDRSGERIMLRAGEGFLFAGNAYQHYESCAEQPWDVRWLHFTASFPLELLREAGLYGGILFSFTNSERFIELLEGMHALCAPFELNSEPKLSAAVYELLAQLALHTERLESQSQLQKRNAMRTAADRIRKACSESWDLEKMAALTGYSPYHFLRSFRETIGITPNQFLTQCRIVEARLLLVTTSLTIKEIGTRCGFSQTSYFIRVFRQSERLSPSQYRLLHSNRERK
ncbi:AraC family transcriptional regulator [Paenibacillus sp. HB172176]|uniref:helix-turn-helix transcriptional regulator n=1 Tax=Paenibacillus sp. HB172176 TaxID=2493690 RepID=UPI00143B49A4|nr:AraC family transcriptional regulator [Paenibacillus sp. HB172176]